jgi:hypothetical protein
MKYIVIGRNSRIYNSLRGRLEFMSDEIIELSHTQFEAHNEISVAADKILLFAIDKKSEENTLKITEKAIVLSNTLKCELILISSAICYVDNVTKLNSYSRLKHLQERIVVDSCSKYKIFRLGYFKVDCDLPYIKKIGNSIFVLGNRNSVLPAFDESSFFNVLNSLNTNGLYSIFTSHTKFQETNACFPKSNIFFSPRIAGIFFLMLSKLLRAAGLINISNKIARPFYGKISFT